MSGNSSEINFIDSLKVLITKLVVNFREGRNSEGYELVLTVIDRLEKLLSYININNTNEELIWINNLNDNLVEIVKALQNKDYILVSDLFEYEILPLLGNIENKN